MNLVDIILLSIALGIDCLIVSFSQGLIFKSQRVKNSFNLAFFMGLFQGLMPVIGYIAVNKIYKYLLPYSRHIVFTIFFIIGLHFILEAIRNEQKQEICSIGIKCLISLSIATSMDALIAGTTIKLTSTSLLLCCLLFGLFSFVMSELGFWFGNFIKNIPAKFLQIFGGIILIVLAFKALN